VTSAERTLSDFSIAKPVMVRLACLPLCPLRLGITYNAAKNNVEELIEA
jgi:hypothetical protein